MSEQPNNRPPQGPGGNNNNRRHNNRRRRPQRPQGQGNNAEPRQASGQPNQQHQGPRPQGQPQGQNQGNNQRRRRPQHNRGPRPGGPAREQQQQGFNLDRVYEKYLNLLDQHLIARRKYHDLYYRAEPAQKAKLERNFYNTLGEVREFENRLAPDVRELFEKRNNGYQNDRIYTTNHELPIEGDKVPEDLIPEDPHLLQSQVNCDFSNDTEESIGTAEDYLRYKNL